VSGGWAGSTRRSRLPANWPALRKQRLELDGYQCTAALPSGIRCPAAATEVDHVQAMTDDHSLDALRSLCGPHHRAKSAAEGGQAAGARAKRRAALKRRPAEKHPGLI
jgi:hypothetical protein